MPSLMAAFRSPNPIQCICPSLHSTVRDCHQSNNGTGTPKVGAIHKETLPKEHSAQMRSDQTKPCIVLQSFLRIFLEIEETMIEVQRSFLSHIRRFDCESCPTLLELDTYEEPCHAVPIALRF